MTNVSREDLDGARRADGPRPDSVLERLQVPRASAAPIQLREAPDPGVSQIPVRAHGATSLGHYRLDGEIARGGVGVVLKGHDVDLGRDVALKVLREEHADDLLMLARFVEEAQIGGQLQHPGIVPVYELGVSADRRPFFAMKLVKGRTLAALLAERRDPSAEPRRYLVIFQAVCQTMAYAHARGVIHRDLKPSNVMVGAFGEVQVVDWGLSRVLARGGAADERRAKPRVEASVIETVRSSSTGSNSLAGSVMGTPAYMPPEQARGEVERVDARADVFSLGAVLCELLTGSPPYVGTSQQVLEQATNARLEYAEARLAECGADEELVQLARSCLRPDPRARPPSAEAMAQTIEGYLGRADERARQAEVEAAEARIRASEERKARKLVVALAASLSLAAVLGGGGWLWIEHGSATRRTVTETAVNGALEEVALLRGQERWSEALGAAKRAQDLARTGEANPVLVAKTSALLAEVQERENQSRLQEERRRKDEQMVRRLDEIASVKVEMEENLPERREREYGEAFHDYGIDLDALSEQECVARISASSIALRLSLALDAWARCKVPGVAKEMREKRVAVARIADPDPWRNRLRDAKDLAAVQALAREADPEHLATETLVFLSSDLSRLGDHAGATELLRKSLPSHPGDYWIHHFLTRRLMEIPQVIPLQGSGIEDRILVFQLSPRQLEALGSRVTEALSHAVTGVALRPQSPGAWILLGDVRFTFGDDAGAIEAYRRSLEIDPGLISAHVNLALALFLSDQKEAALVKMEEAARRKPGDALILLNLSHFRRELGDLAGSIAALREAVHQQPDGAIFHVTLAERLENAGEMEEAIAEAREGARLGERYTYAHMRLAGLLQVTGDFEGAIHSYRNALRLDPENGDAHFCCAAALEAAERYEEAIVEVDRAHELGNARLFPYEERRHELQQQASVQERFPAILRGEAQPLDVAEARLVAWRCYLAGQFVRGVAFYSDVLATDPSFTDRYNAACCAARAAEGSGDDESALTSDERIRLTTRAVAWLSEALTTIEDSLAGASDDQRSAVASQLVGWTNDRDLEGLRNEARIAALPQEVREACQDLWRRLAALQARASATGTATR